MPYIPQRGIGLSPGDACYDSSRPSWLPYWIDDTQESECVSGTSNWWDAGWSYLGQQTGAAATGAISSAASGAASGAGAGLTDISFGGAGLIAAAVLGGFLLLKAFK